MAMNINICVAQQSKKTKHDFLRDYQVYGFYLAILSSAQTKTRKFFQDQGRQKFQPQEYIKVF